LKFIAFVLFIILFNSGLLKCEQKYKYNQSVYFLLGYPAGPNAEDFFNIYHKYVGGSNDDFRVTPIVGVGTKFTLKKTYKVGLLFYYYQSSFKDNFVQKILPTPESNERWVSEDLVINSYPLFVTFEFNPYLKSQFNSYYGIGLGCNFGNVDWTETVIVSEPGDRRKGGVLVNESTYSLVGRAYVGLELGFDKKSRKYLLGGLIFEAAYVYDSRRIDMFDKLYTQFFVKHEEFKNKYPMIPGIFELSMAVSLVFE
jgi:hypothetical protein